MRTSDAHVLKVKQDIVIPDVSRLTRLAAATWPFCYNVVAAGHRTV